ncbi:MAG: hypothetical protein HZA51_00850 [Planctomycetes bacterium]|nr:hypothetical protein [Planctomycetota bacterium]
MKMPNFRLSETQATASMIVGVLGLASLAALCMVVLKNFNTQTWTILYSEVSQFGKFRKILVFLFTAITVVLGCVSLAMGFSSLGQKKNTKQGRSFMGMAIGGIAIAIAPVLLTLWINRSEAVITKLAD